MSIPVLDVVTTISRLTKDSDNPNKESFQLNEALMGVKMNIQPATPEDTAIAGGVFGQTFVGFTTESGIQRGDLVTVSGTGQLYRIRGIEDWSSPDDLPHFELLLVSFEDEQLI